MIETWCAMLNKGQKVGATIIDSSKAFRTLNHKLLLTLCALRATGNSVGGLGCGAPCYVPTWVEHAQNNDVLVKIESQYFKLFQG